MARRFGDGAPWLRGVEVTVIKKQFRRLAAAAAVASLLATIVVAGSASAGNTRVVYIGDPGGSIGSGYGTQTYTSVHAGGLTATDVQVRNDSSNTLNHATLFGGTAADNAPENPLFIKPTGKSLPTGLTYVAAYPPTGVTCTIANQGTSLSCDLGSFPGFAKKTVRVVIQTSGVTDHVKTWYGVYLNEGNQTGSNQDNFYSTGTITTGATDCSGGADANYFLPTTTVALSTDPSCLTAVAAVTSGDKLIGKGGFGSLSVRTSNLTSCQGTGYTCVGAEVKAAVLDGNDVPGGLQWTITWYGTRTASGVIHFLDTYDANDPAHASDYKVILFTKAYQCSAKLTTNCWVSTSASKPNATPLWFKVTVITPNNGTKRILA